MNRETNIGFAPPRNWAAEERCRQAAALPLNTRCCKSKLGFLPVLSCVSSLIAAELDDRGAIHLFAPLHGREGAHEFDMQCKYRCCVRVMNKVIIHVANDAT